LIVLLSCVGTGARDVIKGENVACHVIGPPSAFIYIHKLLKADSIWRSV